MKEPAPGEMFIDSKMSRNGLKRNQTTKKAKPVTNEEQITETSIYTM